MSILKVVDASEATVAVGATRESVVVMLHSLSFYSHTSDVTVKAISGGASGTTKVHLMKDATTAVGDDFVQWVAGDPKGAQIPDGLYIEITGTANVTVEYTPKPVG